MKFLIIQGLKLLIKSLAYSECHRVEKLIHFSNCSQHPDVSRQHSKASSGHSTLYLHEITENIKNSVLSNLIYDCFGFVDKILLLWE